jgi:hypothetical protein
MGTGQVLRSLGTVEAGEGGEETTKKTGRLKPVSSMQAGFPSLPVCHSRTVLAAGPPSGGPQSRADGSLEREQGGLAGILGRRLAVLSSESVVVMAAGLAHCPCGMALLTSSRCSTVWPATGQAGQAAGSADLRMTTDFAPCNMARFQSAHGRRTSSLRPRPSPVPKPATLVLRPSSTSQVGAVADGKNAGGRPRMPDFLRGPEDGRQPRLSMRSCR